MLGNIALKIANVSGWSWAMALLKDTAVAPKMKPMIPTPIPHQNARGRRSPNDRAAGPPRPSAIPGMLGHGMWTVTPRSRRENATTPTANRITARIAPGTSDAQSYWPASGWWWAVQPHHVRFASGANAGTAAWYPLAK